MSFLKNIYFIIHIHMRYIFIQNITVIKFPKTGEISIGILRGDRN